jgi:hypothetical protein
MDYKRPVYRSVFTDTMIFVLVYFNSNIMKHTIKRLLTFSILFWSDFIITVRASLNL